MGTQTCWAGVGWGLQLLPWVQGVCGAPNPLPAPVHLAGVHSKCNKCREKC